MQQDSRLQKEMEMARKWLSVHARSCDQVASSRSCLDLVIVSTVTNAYRALVYWRHRRMFVKHGATDAFEIFMGQSRLPQLSI